MATSEGAHVLRVERGGEMDGGSYYTTVQGDMWDSIAHRFYGDVKYFCLLLQYNPDLLDIFVFSAGTMVYIPEIPEDEDEDVPEWRA